MKENPMTNRPPITGLPQLDQILGPLTPGHLIVLAGRSQSGMTTTALHLARTAAVDQGTPVLFADTEDHVDQLFTRIVATVSGVDSTKICAGDTTDAQEIDVAFAVQILADAPLTFLDTPRSLEAVQVAAMAMERRPRLVVIDGTRFLVDGVDEERMSALSRGLKWMARQLQTAVVVTSPMNNSAGPSIPPTLSDLGAGAPLLYDADQVVLLHRPEMYDPDTSRFGELDLIVAKNRHGVCDRVTVSAAWNTGRVVDFPLPPASAA
jgi:replicative DNA helicase